MGYGSHAAAAYHQTAWWYFHVIKSEHFFKDV
jgi:hypothetical protein